MTKEREQELICELEQDHLLAGRGLQVLTLEEGFVRLQLMLDADEEVLRSQLHHGLLYALAETAASLAVRTTRQEILRPISYTMDYPQQQERPTRMLLAEGKLSRAGKSICFCTVQVRDEAERLLCRMDTEMALDLPAQSCETAK